MTGHLRLLPVLLASVVLWGCRSLGVSGEFQAYHPDGSLRTLHVRGDTLRLEMSAPNYGTVHIATARFRREGDQLIFVEDLETGVGSDMLIKADDADATVTVEDGGRVIAFRGSVDQGWFGRQEIEIVFRKK